jgi:hypothetical protein
MIGEFPCQHSNAWLEMEGWPPAMEDSCEYTE